jgi:beta-glucanase (GH16 family)
MKKSLVFLAVFVAACIDNSPIIERDFSTEEPYIAEKQYIAEEVFMEDFNDYGENTQPNNFNFGSGGKNQNTWINGAISEIEKQTKVMKLAMVPENDANPWQGANFESKEKTLFGRYSARIKIPSVQIQPNVGGVVGFFTYYNDLYNHEQEKDINENGLSDNSEIDFEWLIANPQLVYLTAWTDSEENGNCRKIARIINLATGQILTTNYSTKLGTSGTQLTGSENEPSTISAIPNFDASKDFDTYGFDWKTDNIRWWIINPNKESDTIVLWNYRGKVERITQKPAYLMFNFWHTNDWAAEGKPQSKQKPNETFWAEFDFIKYESLSEVKTQ